MKKTFLSLLLAAVLTFSMTFSAVFADDFFADDSGDGAAETAVDTGGSAVSAEPSVDTGDGIVAEAAEGIGDGTVKAAGDSGDGIVRADEPQDVITDAEDVITDAEEPDGADATESSWDNADGFCDSVETELLSDGGEAETDPVSAGETVGLGVASHTLEEIVAYMKNNGATLEDEVTYDTEPELTAPYSAGVLSDATKNSALAILNNVRYIAGLSEVTLDDTRAKSQQAASIIGAANGGISHYPSQPDGMSDDLYSLGYSACGVANLGAGHKTLNVDIVQGWMGDSDASNISCVGHRRWCLNPSMGKTAFGAVTGVSTGYGTYYSMYSMDGSNTEASETLVAWPAQQMPLEYFGDDYAWSLSVGKTVTAADITVTLTRGSESWSFSSTSADGYFTVNNSAYGQTGCIIFRPDSITYAADDVFTVTVTGLDQTVSYTVHFFKLDDYWHTHSYRLSDWDLSADESSASVVYTCACGDTYTETVAMTTTVITEAACESAGQNLIWFKDKNNSTHGIYRTIAALGHELPSVSLNGYVISGTCSRCGETVSEGAATGFEVSWGGLPFYSDSAEDIFVVEAGDTLTYSIPADYLTSSSGLSDINREFVAESSDTDVISIEKTSESAGVLTMKKGGWVTITVYPKFNPSLKQIFTFEVYCADGSHIWDDKAVTKATLTQNGKTAAKCSVCGAESSDYTEISRPAEIRLEADSYSFDNKVKAPEVTVTDAKGNVLSEGEDYTVEYASGRKNVGAYKVTITFRGDYSGTAERSFTILPKGTAISRLKAGKKSMTVILKKQKKQTTGYQMQYSTSKSFKNAKRKTIRKNSTVKAVCKGLKSGKKYYVRVRTYKKVNGKTYYSAWSKAKTVKVK